MMPLLQVYTLNKASNDHWEQLTVVRADSNWLLMTIVCVFVCFVCFVGVVYNVHFSPISKYKNIRAHELVEEMSTV